ncbi:L-2-amino-thiazoline-4-carboxylic acid hydrolase [Flavobacteriaceae bacterium 3-367]
MSVIAGKYKLNWAEKSFMRAFPRRIPNLDKTQLPKLQESFALVFENEKEHITDRQSQTHYIMCAYVLAAHQLLLAQGLHPEKSMEALTQSFGQFGARWVKWSMRIAIWFRVYTRKYLESNTLKTIRARYGNTFSVQEEKEKDSYALVVHKCGYHGFFLRNGHPELTPIFCQWDNIWSEEINTRKSGINFKRPTTIAENKLHCRFEFHFEKPQSSE